MIYFGFDVDLSLIEMLRDQDGLLGSFKGRQKRQALYKLFVFKMK